MAHRLVADYGVEESDEEPQQVLNWNEPCGFSFPGFRDLTTVQV